MIRARLRSWLLKSMLGADPVPMMESLHCAVAALQATLAENQALHERIDQLERVALVAVDPLECAALQERGDPYLDAVGVVVCTATDARVIHARPLERMAADDLTFPDTVRC